jgi:hypothetical protein
MWTGAVETFGTVTIVAEDLVFFLRPSKLSEPDKFWVSSFVMFRIKAVDMV